ncbi:hypothetical protein NBRC116592_17240 [Colwellia sp. KU-HH00111]|uniref:NYN domain-containing protein n=1 Tax=Colwellia sp. KU-HH00111 TaxID=3127652 RepID=UPI003108F210
MKNESIALLIDAENVSPPYLNSIITALESIGSIGIKRAYANWTSNSSESWLDILALYAIEPIHQYKVSTKKNATDIRLTVEAMELALSHSIENFCIVSSDSDYTPLVTALRKAGKSVIGFGLPHTPKRTILAYNHFYELPNINNHSTNGNHIDSIKIKSDGQDIIRKKCSNMIIEHVKSSPIAVSTLNLTTQTNIKKMKLSPDWCGEGSFTKFLNSLYLGPLQIKNNYIFCPHRHGYP